MYVDPGELNKKIKIISKSDGETYDDEGHLIEDIQVVRECWARVSSISGTELIKAGTEFADAKKRFLVRWTPTEINTSMYLLYMGELHNIQYVNRYRDNKDYMEIWTDWKGQEADENWIEPVKEGDDSGTS